MLSEDRKMVCVGEGELEQSGKVLEVKGAGERLGGRDREFKGFKNTSLGQLVIKYDKSEFSSSAHVSDSEEGIEEVWKKEYTVSEFVDHSKFKSYDELKNRLHKVIGDDIR